jgi:phosphate:Na+ symporter
MHLPTGKWAVSRFQGYAGGVLTGAIFESSSLVTSYLASFANGGLLTASGALGLILGANLGSTLLPQILSLRVAWLTAPFLAAGTLLLLLPRRANLGSWGWVFLGAGLVLVGWEVLAESAGLAALSHTFRDEFLFAQVDYGLAFSRYAARFLAYFFTGALAAFLLRTSNLIVVIAMLLAASGTIQVPTAVPLVLGANLGSAAMVFALSLRKRREAKRLALSNLLVQVFGCAGAVVLSLIPIGGRTPFIWLIESVSPARAVADLSGNVATQVACAHTLYNLAAGWVFLAFPWALLGPLDRLLPGAGASADLKPYLLDRNLISVPSLALRQATEEVVYLTEVCRKTTAEAFDSFRYNDLSLSEQVLRRGEVITGIHREVIQYLVAISENQLARRDATQLKVLQTAADSLARIGEQGERLRDLAARKIEERIGGHEEVDRDLTEAYDLVLAQFANILTLLRHHDPKTEESAVKLVERLAKFSTRIEGQWRQRLETPGSPPAPMSIHLQAVLYQEAFGILFRIAAHLAHIAQSMRILAPERM